MKAKVTIAVTDTRANVFGPRIFREFTITFAPAVSHLGYRKSSIVPASFHRAGKKRCGHSHTRLSNDCLPFLMGVHVGT